LFDLEQELKKETGKFIRTTSVIVHSPHREKRDRLFPMKRKAIFI
jgi:hypothetical protein